LDDLDKRTWWQCCDGDAALASISPRLHPSIVSFLKAAWHGFALDDSEPTHDFHRYVVGLASPEQLWQNVNYAEDEDDSNKQRYFTLYMANWALGVSHPLGLILDQENGTAMQHMSIHDSDVTMNGRKIVAVDEDYDGEQERTEPWIMPSYSERDLNDTLRAFQSLVDALCARIPDQIQHTENSLFDLVTGGDLECLPSNSFAYRFLSQAKVPPFFHIAPGLRIANHQPFAEVPLTETSAELFPLLLFTSTEPTCRETRRAPWGEDILDSPFAWEFHSVSTYPAGLYLRETEPQSTHPFEGGCKLVLPYTLGNNMCARTSDGAFIGENVHSHGDVSAADIEPKSVELYQLGYNRFIETHDVQLKHVL
ncbi:hypothetical protein KCU95_g9415, partial [Aureobasidium melanogenum]